MGLDMYLFGVKKVFGVNLVEIDPDVLRVKNPALYETVKQYVVEKGSLYKYNSFQEDWGYWRKANAIHGWFVDNVQDGEDNCNEYIVQRRQIEVLLGLCQRIKENHSLAPELLPVTKGFFFGSDQYDEWYFEDIDKTIEICERVLESFNYEEDDLYYQSSW